MVAGVSSTSQASGRAPRRRSELYQTQAVGIPEDVAVQMPNAPFRPGLEAIAQTLAYDAMTVGDRSLPTDLIASITAPASGCQGGCSCRPAWRRMRDSNSRGVAPNTLSNNADQRSPLAATVHGQY
jgi:hypothetical protein